MKARGMRVVLGLRVKTQKVLVASAKFDGHNRETAKKRMNDLLRVRSLLSGAISQQTYVRTQSILSI
jgi:hypothetical protein